MPKNYSYGYEEDIQVKEEKGIKGKALQLKEEERH